MKVQELDQSPEWKKNWEAFICNPKGFLLFAGRNGTGKTFASEAIFRQVIIPFHLEKMFYTQVDLHMKWNSDMKRWGDASYFFERLVEAQLLVLDDLGTRVPTESFKDFLYAIIEKRERFKHEKGTVITTNLNAEQMRNIFGDAIVSRVASGQVFRFEGKDRRFNAF